MKNTDPLMGAKLKSKTHLLNKFFLFFEPFFARLASKFENSNNMTKKNFFEKIKIGIKNAEVLKSVPKKVICKNVTKICTF